MVTPKTKGLPASALRTKKLPGWREVSIKTVGRSKRKKRAAPTT